MALTLYISNDNLIRLNGLTDERDDSAVAGATVTVTLFESDGVTEVTPQSWPLTLTDDGGGDYFGILEDDLNVTDDQELLARVTADGGADVIGQWDLKVYARIRTS